MITITKGVRVPIYIPRTPLGVVRAANRAIFRGKWRGNSAEKSDDGLSEKQEGGAACRFAENVPKSELICHSQKIPTQLFSCLEELEQYILFRGQFQCRIYNQKF